MESPTRHEVPLVSARGLTKRYGPVVAADRVDLDVGHGQILAIVGDNGAGKSTVVKMISGAVTPDHGEIRVDGELATIRSPLDAHDYGIETIYQDLAIAQNLDVITNVYLGRERRRPGLLGRLGVLDRRAMREETSTQLSKLKIDIPDLMAAVEFLSGGQRQSIAIARAMLWTSKLMVMDEPTAALGASQSEAVLDIVKGARDHGISVVIISHILPHVLELADRVAVMRHGRKVADFPSTEIGERELINLIIGAEQGPGIESTLE